MLRADIPLHTDSSFDDDHSSHFVGSYSEAIARSMEMSVSVTFSFGETGRGVVFFALRGGKHGMPSAEPCTRCHCLMLGLRLRMNMLPRFPARRHPQHLVKRFLFPPCVVPLLTSPTGWILRAYRDCHRRCLILLNRGPVNAIRRALDASSSVAHCLICPSSIS